MTLSSDGTVSRIASDGTSVVVVRNVKRGADFAYSTSSTCSLRCEPEDLCLLEITRQIAAYPPKDPSYEPRTCRSPDDSELALLSPRAICASSTWTLRPFGTTGGALPRSRRSPDGLLFVNRDAIAASLQTVSRSFIETARCESLSIRWYAMDTGPVDHDLVCASSKGELILVSTDNLRITNRARVCHDAVSGLKSLRAKQQSRTHVRKGRSASGLPPTTRSSPWRISKATPTYWR